MASILDLMYEEDSITSEIEDMETQLKYFDMLYVSNASIGRRYSDTMFALGKAIRDAHIKRIHIHEQIKKEIMGS